MEKKTYISPSMEVLSVELQLMNAYTGGDPNNGIVISSSEDMSDEDNLSRGAYNLWEEDD